MVQNVSLNTPFVFYNKSKRFVSKTSEKLCAQVGLKGLVRLYYHTVCYIGHRMRDTNCNCNTRSVVTVSSKLVFA